MRYFKQHRFLIALWLCATFTLLSCGSENSKLKDEQTAQALDPDRALVAFARSLQATTDVSESLVDVLEEKNLEGACAEHWARLDPLTKKLPSEALTEADAIKAMLRCGKWIFFSADFESKMAIPENVLKAVTKIFGEEAGPAFSRAGLIENPNDPGMPVGFPRLKGSPWGALGAFTGAPRGIACATCHFGKMPREDGQSNRRYAVGMPNQDLDFGKINAMLMYSAWRADSKSKDLSIWPADLQAFYQQLDKKLGKTLAPERTLFDVAKIVAVIHASDKFYKFTGASRPILSESSTFLSGTPNQYYASSPLLPIKNKSYWMSAPQMWDMESYRGDWEAGRARPLSTVSPVKNAEDFTALALIFQTGLDRWAEPTYVDPLLLYMRSLKTPEPLQKVDGHLAEIGKNIFEERCVSCHNAKSGATLQAYSAAEMGTPEVLVDILKDFEPTKDLSSEIYRQTVKKIGYDFLHSGGIYSRPLKGIYARRHLMINGSVADLDEAFCINGPRGVASTLPPGLSDAVHLDLCDDYSLEEKEALSSFLKSWY